MMRAIGWALVVLLWGACGDDAARVDADAASEIAPDTMSEIAPDAGDANDDIGDASEVTPEIVDEPNSPPDRNEPKAAASGALRAGVATLALDAPVGISMGGFGGRSGPTTSAWSDLFFASTGSHGSLLLKAIAFEVAGERMVLVKLPLPFSEDSLTHEMIAQLKSRHGLDLEGRVITAATHTHHGPARFWRLPGPLGIAGIDTPDAEVIRLMAGKMADVVALAIDGLDLAEWGYVMTDNWDPDDHIYRDRRHVNDARWGKDPRLTVIGVRRPDGTPIVALANFAMHGTILADSNALLSEDAAGGFEQGLEAALFARFGTHVVGMFTQAAGGDAQPAGDWLGHSGEQRMAMIGYAAPNAVLAAWDRIAWSDTSELAVRSRLIGVRHHWIYGDSHEFDNASGNPIEYGTVNCTISPEENISQQGGPKKCGELAELFPLFGVSLPDPELNQLYMTVARLGPLYLMTIPGEPTYSLMEYARTTFAAEAPGNDVMVLGYSQDHMLYFSHPDDWYLGGYEAEFNVWGPWAGKWLVDRQLAIVRAMRDGNNGPTYYEESPDFSPPLSDATREIEASTVVGVVVSEPPERVARMDVVDIVVSGGDPVLGMPRFELQRDEDGFVPVPDAVGGAYDNGRYDGVTRYAPIPAPSKARIARDHRWMWRWQVPPTMPAGRYRIVASGRAKTTEVGDWSVETREFTIGESANATLEATRIDEGQWLLKWTQAPEPIVKSEGDREPLRGWQVFDPGVGPNERIHVREPLTLAFTVDGVMHPQVVEATWDNALGGQVLEAGDLPFELSGATVSAHLASDLAPAVLSTILPR